MTAMFLTTAMVSSTPAAADDVEECREWIEKRVEDAGDTDWIMDQIPDIGVTDSSNVGPADNPCVPDDIPEPQDDLVRLEPDGPQSCILLCDDEDLPWIVEEPDYLVDPQEVSLWVMWCRVDLPDDQDVLTVQLNAEKECLTLNGFTGTPECGEDGNPVSYDCVAIVDEDTPGVKDRDIKEDEETVEPPFSICEQRHKLWVLNINAWNGKVRKVCDDTDP